MSYIIDRKGDIINAEVRDMYQLLALLTGLTVAVMVSLNGHLSQQYGTYLAAVIIHIVGSLAALLMCAVKKEKRLIRKRFPVWFYLGGAIGAFTTLFNNFAFGHISMTSIVALGLLGQTVTSLAIDGLGLFGMEKRPFQRSTLIGVAFSLAGMIFMLDRSVTQAVYAVFFSLGAGITVVLSRSVNARLAEEVGPLRGSLINHLVGLPVTVIIAMLAFMAAPSNWNVAFSPRLWIYLGGVLGVVTVLLCNVTVPKIAAFSLTVLTFVGQFFTGIILDIASGSGYSNAYFVGGIIIAVGIAVTLAAERVAYIKAKKQEAYWARLKSIEDEHRQKVYGKYL